MPAHLRQLTAFRFFAAAWVVLFGFWGLLRPESVFGPPPALVAKGYLGVELFFVLSGFILSHVYAEARTAGRFRYGGFIWARVARIYPLHLLTTLAMGALALLAGAIGAAVEHDVANPAALPANLLLVHAWGVLPSGSWNHPSWSVSAEWAAYLAFPLFAAGVARLRGRPAVGLALGLAVVFAAYALFERAAGFPLTRATTGWGWLRIAPPFLYGCLLHGAWRDGAGPEGRAARLAALLFLAMMGVAAALQAPDSVTVGAAGGLILSLAGMSASGARALASPAWVWLGEVSFALYMVKTPVEVSLGNVLKRLTGTADGAAWPLWSWLVLLAGALAAAAAAHHLVERPARTALRRLGELRPARPREEAAPSL